MPAGPWKGDQLFHLRRRTQMFEHVRDGRRRDHPVAGKVSHQRRAAHPGEGLRLHESLRQLLDGLHPFQPVTAVPVALHEFVMLFARVAVAGAQNQPGQLQTPGTGQEPGLGVGQADVWRKEQQTGHPVRKVGGQHQRQTGSGGGAGDDDPIAQLAGQGQSLQRRSVVIVRSELTERVRAVQTVFGQTRQVQVHARCAAQISVQGLAFKPAGRKTVQVEHGQTSPAAVFLVQPDDTAVLVRPEPETGIVGGGQLLCADIVVAGRPAVIQGDGAWAGSAQVQDDDRQQCCDRDRQRFPFFGRKKTGHGHIIPERRCKEQRYGFTVFPCVSRRKSGKMVDADP